MSVPVSVGGGGVSVVVGSVGGGPLPLPLSCFFVSVDFDDVEGAALASTPLTTVRVYKEQLGEVALGLLAAFAAVTVWVGERLYRRALLQTGGRVSLRQAWATAE